MYCRHCGNQLELDSKFCSKCGEEVSKGFEEPSKETVKNEVKVHDEKVSIKKVSNTFGNSKWQNVLMTILIDFLILNLVITFFTVTTLTNNLQTPLNIIAFVLITIYHEKISQKIRFLTPGEKITGRVFVNSNKEWINPYKKNRFFLYSAFVLMMLGTTITGIFIFTMEERLLDSKEDLHNKMSELDETNSFDRLIYKNELNALQEGYDSGLETIENFEDEIFSMEVLYVISSLLVLISMFMKDNLKGLIFFLFYLVGLSIFSESIMGSGFKISFELLITAIIGLFICNYYYKLLHGKDFLPIFSKIPSLKRGA